MGENVGGMACEARISMSKVTQATQGSQEVTWKVEKIIITLKQVFMRRKKEEKKNNFHLNTCSSIRWH